MNGIVITTLKQAKRVVVIVVGFTVLLAGVAMIVLPGPAFIVIPLGLAILATEFVWARNLLKKVKEKIGVTKDEK
jgi:tellurite resistance protein TerC